MWWRFDRPAPLAWRVICGVAVSVLSAVLLYYTVHPGEQERVAQLLFDFADIPGFYGRWLGQQGPLLVKGGDGAAYAGGGGGEYEFGFHPEEEDASSSS